MNQTSKPLCLRCGGTHQEKDCSLPTWGDFLDTLREPCQECDKLSRVTEELYDDEGWVEGYLFRCPSCKWEESFGIYEVIEMKSSIFHDRTFREIMDNAHSKGRDE